MKKTVKYCPTLTQESLNRIKQALEKINEQAHRTAYPPKRPTLRIIRGGKS
jgi:hypothetical protein